MWGLFLYAPSAASGVAFTSAICFERAVVLEGRGGGGGGFEITQMRFRFRKFVLASAV